MSRIYRLYLKDILKSIDKVQRFTDAQDFDTFTADEMRVDSVLHNLMVIGEAVKNIPDEVRDKMPEIEWRDIGRFRDLVVHHYFGIKLDIVWSIIQDDLKSLQTQITELLNTLDTDENIGNQD